MAFARRRARVRAGQLSAMALVVAAVVAAGGSFDPAATRAFDAGVSDILAEADPTARGIVVDAPLGDDASEQDAEMAAAISEAFDASPVTVSRAVHATASALGDEGSPFAMTVLADVGVPDRARLVEGAWPAASAEVALTARAAERSGLGLGDALTLDGAAATVVGVWEADDAGDPRWSGDPSVGSGRDGEAVGPALAIEDLVAAVERTPHVRWTILPTTVTTASAPAYIAAVGALEDAVDVIDPGGARGVRVEGDLEATLDRALGAVTNARGVLVVPLLAFLAVGVITLGVIAAALQRARRAEVSLMRARGSSSWSLLAASIAEAAVVGASGAVVGAVIAVVAGGADAVAAVFAALAGTVTTMIVVAVLAASHAAAIPSERSERSDAGRGSVLAVAGPLLLIGIVAALAIVQLLLLGGVVTSSGRLDPLAAAAGGLVLVTLGLVAALAVGPAALGASRLVRRGRGLTPVLALRRLARASGALTAGVLCVALAAGSAALAWRFVVEVDSERANMLVGAVGTDLRASYDVQESIDQDHPGAHSGDLRDAPGVDGAFAALTRTSSVGAETVRAVVAPADELAALAAAGSVTDAAALADLAVGTPLPYSGESLTVVVTATPAAGSSAPPPGVEVSVWSVDADGAPRQTLVGTAPADGEAHALEVALSDTGLLALDVSARKTAESEAVGDQIALAVTASDATGALPLPRAGALSDGAPSTRLVTVTDVPEELPAVITEALAARVDAEVGDALTVRVGSAPRAVPVRVSGIAASLPGVGDGAGFALDLGALSAHAAAGGGALPAADELWVRTDDIPAAETSVRAVSTDPVVIHTAASVGTDPVLVPTRVLFAALAAAAALLAVVGFLVVVAGVGRSRRAEALPLRAFGFDVAAQRRARVVEVATAAGFAVAAGVLAGILTAVLVLPAIVPALTGVIA